LDGYWAIGCRRGVVFLWGFIKRVAPGKVRRMDLRRLRLELHLFVHPFSFTFSQGIYF
jgi:hypothetical protein